eukprot:12451979-Ditylum_brightwellii.AAC.1
MKCQDLCSSSIQTPCLQGFPQINGRMIPTQKYSFGQDGDSFQYCLDYLRFRSVMILEGGLDGGLERGLRCAISLRKVLEEAGIIIAAMEKEMQEYVDNRDCLECAIYLFRHFKETDRLRKCTLDV